MVQAHTGIQRKSYVTRSGLCCAILLLLFPLLSFSGDAVDVGDPTVTIVVDQDTKEANVEPGDSGLVIFTGTVVVEPALGGGAQQYRVELTVTSVQGWATTISPSSILFSGSGGSSPFTLSVRVPPATSCDEEDTVTIGGTCTSIPGTTQDIDEETVTVLVRQYFLFEATCNPTAIETTGGPERYILRIENKGNGDDKFNIEIENRDHLEMKDISVSLETTSIYILRGFTENIIITVATDDETVDINKYSIEIMVYSYGSEMEGETVSATMVVYYDYEGRGYSIALAGALVIIIIVLVAAGVMLDRRRRIRKMRALIAKMREEKE